MLIYKLFFLFAISFILVCTSDASTTCKDLTSAQAIVECALIKHPDINVGEAEIKASRQSEELASQFPNPEFEMRSLRGESLGNSMETIEADLGFIIQLGGKRNARIQTPRSEQAKARASMLKIMEHVYIDNMKILVRLRQLAVEIDAIEHALEAFGSIQKLYRAYGQLSPEQQISMNIFQLAQGDYRARKTQRLTEQQRLVKKLNLALGEEIVLTSTMYPQPYAEWPTLEFNGELNGSGIRLVQADIKNAEATVDSAYGSSWPDLTLGPAMSEQTDGPFTYQTWGSKLGLNIPIVNINGGGRAFAQAELMAAKASMDSERAKLLNEKDIIIQQYNTILESLGQLPAIEAIEKKHQGAESYFRRGLLSTSLMVEYHRQIVDFITSKNELELQAMKTLWKVRALEGKLFPKMN